jgi:hypothetical protein
MKKKKKIILKKISKFLKLNFFQKKLDIFKKKLKNHIFKNFLDVRLNQ